MPRSGIQLAYPFEEKRLAKWQPPYIVQPKYDGDRCSNTPLPTAPLLLSSEENPFFSVPHINQQLTDSNFYKWPLDGELYNHNLYLEGGHELIHSICSRTVNLHPRYKEMEFHVFDVKWMNKVQMQRTLTLRRSQHFLPPSVRVAPFYVCGSLDEVKRVYDKILRLGYEGIIIRHIHASYIKKRSIYMMKFKPKQKDEYKIVGWKEEHTIDGIPKGVVGVLVCSSEEGDEFGVSAGLDDQQKWKLWQMKDEIVGTTAIVHYQHLTNKKIPKGSFDIEIPELGID